MMEFIEIIYFFSFISFKIVHKLFNYEEKILFFYDILFMFFMISLSFFKFQCKKNIIMKIHLFSFLLNFYLFNSKNTSKYYKINIKILILKKENFLLQNILKQIYYDTNCLTKKI